MPERLNRVQVMTRTEGDVVISWDARNELLERLRDLPEGDQIRQRFEAVGAKRPVVLTTAEETVLLRVLERWVTEVGARNVPEGIARLRDGFLDDEVLDASA